MSALSPAFRLTPGAKLTPARGLWTSAADLVALGVVAVGQQLSLAGVALLGVLLVALCDFGSSARARFQVMGGAMLACVHRIVIAL
jgi:hypothetical protein